MEGSSEAVIGAAAREFAKRRAVLPGALVPSVDAHRAEAVERLMRDGLPTRRIEAWKYTDLRRVSAVAFEPAPAGAALPEALLAELDHAGPLIAIVDGRVAASLSRLADLPDGVSLRPLAPALAGDDRIAARFAATPAGAIADLNAAAAEDGVVLSVAAGVAVAPPIRMVFLNSGAFNSGAGAPVAAHSRIVVDLGPRSSATIVETHAGPDGSPYLATQVFDIAVGAGARLVHLRRQEEGREASHLLSGTVTLAADALYDGFTLSLGAALARTETRLVFAGRGGDGRVTGAYLADGARHVDTTTLIDHAVPDCRSREVFKGVLDERGRGVFQGKIVVRRGAQRTDGHQLSRALLLSRTAEVDTKPELEIYADDVKCSHGATVGEIDAAALFYLRSRGIGEAEARAMLVEGFLAEALEEIADPELRDEFARHVARRLALRRSGE